MKTCSSLGFKGQESHPQTHTQAFSERISAPAVLCTHHRVSHHTGVSQPTVSRSVFVPELMCPHNFTQAQKAVWADRGNTVWPLKAAFNLPGARCSLLQKMVR